MEIASEKSKNYDQRHVVKPIPFRMTIEALLEVLLAIFNDHDTALLTIIDYDSMAISNNGEVNQLLLNHEI